MAIKQLHDFLKNYFLAHHCEIIHDGGDRLTVQLTENMDKILMNRPFYWHYMKKMGYTGEPQQITLITNPTEPNDKGENIHFGSPRLQQILNHLKEKERFTRLFQHVETHKQHALYPWLIVNMKISYIGKQRKDEMLSIGLHLIKGIMKSDMMNVLKQIPLQMTIPDYCYTISPMIRLKSGFRRIESVVEDYIQNQTHTWAVESTNTLEEELALLNHFYTNMEGCEEQQAQMKKEKEEIYERLSPSIQIQVVNGGLFYLKESRI